MEKTGIQTVMKAEFMKTAEATHERRREMAKTLTYGTVGGGPDAFIGDAHRRAIGLDGTAVIRGRGIFKKS
ncbi:MAG: hypothetical protein ACLR0U_21725 [Enterocloster clostridioformis]